MEPIRLFVSPSLVKSAQEMSNPLLKVPEHAVPSKKGGMRWSERLRVEEASVEPVLDANGVTTSRHALRLRFRVSPTSADRTNVNRVTRASYLINLEAEEGTGDRMMTEITLGRIHGLLRACGFTIADTGFDLSEYFCPMSPLINMEVNAVIVDHPDRNDPSIRRQDIGNFTMVED